MQRGRGSRHYIYYESYLNKIFEKKRERESILIILLVCCLKIFKKMNLRSIEKVKIRNSVREHCVVVGSCVTVKSLSVTMIKIAPGATRDVLGNDSDRLVWIVNLWPTDKFCPR